MKDKINLHPLAAGLAAALIICAAPAALAQDDTPAAEDQLADEGEIELVVVTGSRIEQSIEDVAGSISVMTADDIDAMLVNDVSRMFIYEPGVKVTGSSTGAQNFIVRGMGGDRVMMIKDGMRMNEGYGANGANDVVGRGFIDVDTIKQVEVAKGAVSSLYGSDALGGIVAFATKDAADYLVGRDVHFEVNGEYEGASETWGAGALAAFRTGDWETLLSYKYRDGHETQNYTEERPTVNTDSDSLLAKTDYIIDENQKLTFSVDLWEQNIYRPDTGEDHGNYEGLAGWTINELVSSGERKNQSYSARYQNSAIGLPFIDFLNTNLYFNKTEQIDDYVMNYDTPLYGPGTYRDQIRSDLFAQETWGLSASAAKELGDGIIHALSYGFDWDTTETERPRKLLEVVSDGTIRRDEMYATFPKNDTTRLGIYLQDSIDLTEQFTLVPGLRYDYYSMDPQDDPNYDESLGGANVPVEKISDSNVSGRLGMIYELSEQASLYFQYAQGFKVPPYDLAYIYQNHLSIFGGIGIRTIPANDLVPEESDSYEIGIRGEVGDLSYNLSYYYSDYENFIQIAYLGTVEEINTDYGFPLPIDVEIYQYQNIDDARISGFEFRFDYRLTDDFSLLLNGEWMDSEDKSTGEQLPTIQPFNVAFGANYALGSWGFDAMLRWVDDMDKVPDGAFTNDSYTVVDLYARYSLSDRLLLSAGLLNAFDEEYIEYSSIAGVEDSGQDLTLRTQPGRTVSARLRYSF